MEAALTNHVPAMTPAGQAKLKQNIPDPFSVLQRSLEDLRSIRDAPRRQ